MAAAMATTWTSEQANCCRHFSIQPPIICRARIFIPTGSSWGRMVCSANNRNEIIEAEDSFSKYSGYISAANPKEVDGIIDYDSQKISAAFKNRPILLLRRISQIGLKIGRWFGLRYIDSLLGRSETLFQKRVAQLREGLVELGPAFVKIAQAVSSRPDLIPPVYIEELSQLQDRIQPFSTDLALNIIESELGVPVEAIFSEISPQPVAGASLGQVYKARLRPNGQMVAVKVQRPGVRATIALDIYVLRILAGFVKTAAKLNTDLQAVVDQWGSSLFREIDYNSEARNGIRFRKLFGNIPDVQVPQMYTEFTTRRVLVMEWIEGEKLADGKDLRLVEIGTYCSLVQILDTGFYHADPHPGNLLCTTDGKLAYIDFGMMGEIEQDLRDALIEASVHLVNREFDALADDFVTLGFLPASAKASEVSNALKGVLESAVSRGVSNISFGDLSGNLGQTMYKFKFRIPSYFSLIIRSLTVLEGVAITIDTNYKVLGKSYPWIARKMLTDSSPQLRSTLYTLLYKNDTFQIDRLESLISESSKLSNDDGRSAFLNRTAKFILSNQGDYIRDLLLNELVKGIDAWSRIAAEQAISNVEPLQGRLKLVEQQDVRNVETLERMRKLLSTNSSEADAGKWLSIMTQLPFELQQKAFMVPVEIVEKLLSRAIARGLRTYISS